MNRQIEKLKKQLTEIAEVVNSFQSEAVQVRVVDRLLDEIMEVERVDTAEGSEIFNNRNRKLRVANDAEYYQTQGRKKPGATKVLNQLLLSDYFKTPHSISSIASYCKEKFDSEFKTSELSGILLKLAKENKLKRERSIENNRFEYVVI
ncbi:hypothetical protein [Mucilaginibacter aquariorum]|uniref:Uncharacterized protein n=1 Tax=Mucilaginibacter aquariorum TaxID=2967225 RepID=A0ABT1T2M7_9SPHI|nr:hypothetical protein [Mucilaginibacter aquariorum]MCQ6958855.1 hypothetical protein [Mucilaginibacter aquariorum]